MPTLLIEFRNLDEIIAKLGKLQSLKWVRGIMESAGQEVKGAVATYPQAPRRNPLRWYERGFGPKWRSLPENRHQKAGLTKRIKGFFGMRGGIVYGSNWAGYQISETLGRRWTTQVGDTWAKVGNAASYAPYVQDAERQFWFHKNTGWPTIQDEGEKAMERALDKVEAEVDKIWSS